MRLAVIGCSIWMWAGCVGGAKHVVAGEVDDEHICAPERVTAHAVRWEQRRFDGRQTTETVWSATIDLDGRHVGTDASGTERCSRTLASCSIDTIDIDDLDQAIQHSDVEAALETGARQGVPPAFDGADWWWVIAIDDRRFSYGSGCESSSCTDPPGVRALFELLNRIDTEADCPLH